jgi:hypothetical protein
MASHPKPYYSISSNETPLVIAVGHKAPNSQEWVTSNFLLTNNDYPNEEWPSSHQVFTYEDACKGPPPRSVMVTAALAYCHNYCVSAQVPKNQMRLKIHVMPDYKLIIPPYLNYYTVVDRTKQTVCTFLPDKFCDSFLPQPTNGHSYYWKQLREIRRQRLKCYNVDSPAYVGMLGAFSVLTRADYNYELKVIYLSREDLESSLPDSLKGRQWI